MTPQAAEQYLAAPGGGEGLSRPLREEALRILGDETDLLSAVLNRLSDPRWGRVRPPGDSSSAVSLLAVDGILTAVLGAADPRLLPALSEEIKTRLDEFKFRSSRADESEQEVPRMDVPSQRGTPRS